MKDQKQIEEMAWELCDIPKHPDIKSCEQCGNKHCHAMYYAERAYNAGYRKQVEGKWIKHACSYECGVCGDELELENAEDYDPIEDVELYFCPSCGAKMKGETNGREKDEQG